MSQNIINYNPQYDPDLPRPAGYLDPNTLFNERAFTIHPDEEVLLHISGLRYHMEIETIYQLEFENNTFHLRPADKQLCLLVQNKSSNKSIYVSRNTSLAALLEMPRIKNVFCYVSIIQMAKAKLEHAIYHYDSPFENFFPTPPPTPPEHVFQLSQ